MKACLCAIGARIKTARERAGLTQEDLAAELEMSPTHISVLERGVKAPKLETLVKIANTLAIVKIITRRISIRMKSKSILGKIHLDPSIFHYKKNR